MNRIKDTISGGGFKEESSLLFLQTSTKTDRTFTFELFDKKDAQLNVQSLQDVIQDKIQVQDEDSQEL